MYILMTNSFIFCECFVRQDSIICSHGYCNSGLAPFVAHVSFFTHWSGTPAEVVRNLGYDQQMLVVVIQLSGVVCQGNYFINEPRGRYSTQTTVSTC